MSEIVARIHIVVKDKVDWKKLYAMDWLEDYGLLGTGEDVFGECDKHFVCSELACLDMEDFVYSIIELLPDSCLVVADVTDLNVDPYTRAYYYVGGDDLGIEYYDEDCEPELCDMFHKTDINDIKGWFEYGKFKLKAEEIEYLNQYL